MEEELTPAEVEELREQLVSEQEELAALLESSRDSSAPVDLDQPIGRLTRVDAMQHQAMASTLRRRGRIRMQQIQAALRRIEAGTYGECGRCGETIPRKRLRVRPESPLCLECQEEIEG